MVNFTVYGKYFAILGSFSKTITFNILNGLLNSQMWSPKMSKINAYKRKWIKL